MPQGTAIEWTDATWSPVTGCTRVSAGCANCYIERTPPMRMSGRRFTRVGNTETTGVKLHPERLARIPKGPRIFVCSMSDLFHDEVPDTFIAEVFDAMRLHPDRIFQVLTKRPERAAELLPELYDYAGVYELNDYAHDGRPLQNVWLGVSIENARFTWRADVLREIPAAVRFISAEPLLGSLFPNKKSWRCADCGKVSRTGEMETADDYQHAWKRQELDLTGIDWLIAGGESGPGARRTDPTWIRELVEACRREDVAPFVKQLGAVLAREWGCADRKGGNIDEWKPGLSVREFPRSAVPA
jgi:protein gp37